MALWKEGHDRRNQVHPLQADTVPNNGVLMKCYRDKDKDKALLIIYQNLAAYIRIFLLSPPFHFHLFPQYTENALIPTLVLILVFFPPLLFLMLRPLLAGYALSHSFLLFSLYFTFPPLILLFFSKSNAIQLKEAWDNSWMYTVRVYIQDRSTGITLNVGRICFLLSSFVSWIQLAEGVGGGGLVIISQSGFDFFSKQYHFLQEKVEENSMIIVGNVKNV